MLTFYLSMMDSEEDRHKFQIIYDNYTNLIYFVARKLTKDENMVEDIVQETYLKIIRNIEKLRYDNDKEFASLIGIMTRNCAYSYFKENNDNSFQDENFDSGYYQDTIDHEMVIVNSITAQEIMTEIDRMDPGYGLPLRLNLKGYSSSEIGELLDISPENARIRVHRAKKMIAKKLGGKNG